MSVLLFCGFKLLGFDYVALEKGDGYLDIASFDFDNFLALSNGVRNFLSRLRVGQGRLRSLSHRHRLYWRRLLGLWLRCFLFIACIFFFVVVRLIIILVMVVRSSLLSRLVLLRINLF